MSTANTYVLISGKTLPIPAYAVYPPGEGAPPNFVLYSYRTAAGVRGYVAAPSQVPAGAVIDYIQRSTF